MQPKVLTRRQFARKLLVASASVGGIAGMLRAQIPNALVLGARPQVPGGVMAGDITANSAVLWSRSGQASTMLVEYATNESFTRSRYMRGPTVLEDTDYAGKFVLTGLPADQKIFYRIQFESAANTRVVSEPITGSFRTPPSTKRDVMFAWSGDTAGQGYGIDPARGGMRTYEAIRKLQPDFFVHSGDTIYADNPLVEEVKLDDGTIWKNVLTEAKHKVAETLSEFRGNHFYNLLDENVRRFNAEVPVYYQWDDHEVTNNWYPGELLMDDERYKVKSVSLLSARGRRAFFDCLPVRPHPTEQIFRNVPYGPLLELFFLDLRSYRGANSPNRQKDPSNLTAYLGKAQMEELKRALAASTATWKVICSDMPLGLTLRDGDKNFENSCNGDGPPLGRELEIAELLKFIKDKKLHNLIWITADVHHCSSIHYDPDRAVFKEFAPFWEFISGPLHAGTFSPAPLDPTFGPETRFVGVPKGMKPNRPPSEPYQFFGTVKIDGESGALTVTHWNVEGKKLWDITLPAA